MATEKKPNPNAPKPKQNFLMIGGVLIALGAVWFVYEGWLRTRTPEEKKDEAESKIREAEWAHDKAKEEADLKAHGH